MKITETKLKGAFIIQLDKIEDDRGYFARTFCRNEFEKLGLDPQLAQCNVSYSPKKATMRGMHYQMPPHAETKVVRCTRGAIYDAIVDLRPDSPTFLQWTGAELTPDNGKMMYVPKGFAHGVLTLEPETMVFYQTSDFYAPKSCGGVNFNDPRVGVQWPIKVEIVSKPDQNWPLVESADFSAFKDLLPKTELTNQR